MKNKYIIVLFFVFVIMFSLLSFILLFFAERSDFEERSGTLRVLLPSNMDVYIDGKHYKKSGTELSSLDLSLKPGKHTFTANKTFADTPLFVSLLRRKDIKVVESEKQKNEFIKRRKSISKLYRSLSETKNRDKVFQIKAEILSLETAPINIVIPFDIKEGEITELKLSGSWFIDQLSPHTGQVIKLLSTDILRDDPKRIDDFKVQGNGTVIDLKTGLQWMRCSLGQSWDGVTCIGTAKKKYPKQARNFKFAGHDDWRIPTRYELESIVHCSNLGGFKTFRRHPSIETLFFLSCGSRMKHDSSLAANSQFPKIVDTIFPNTEDDTYMSSSETVSHLFSTDRGDYLMYGVNFKKGRSALIDLTKKQSEHKKHFFRLVRSATN